MDVKPAAGIKVQVKAKREAIFGEEGVQIMKTTAFNKGSGSGVLTGRTLAGFAEVEMSGLDAKKHWYPIDQMVTDKGDALVEEEIEIDMGGDDSNDSESGSDSEEEEEA